MPANVEFCAILTIRYLKPSAKGRQIYDRTESHKRDSGKKILVDKRCKNLGLQLTKIKFSVPCQKLAGFFHFIQKFQHVCLQIFGVAAKLV